MLRDVRLQLDAGLLERIETARGDIPRQKFIARVLDGALPGVEGELVTEPEARPSPNVVPPRAPVPGLLPGQRKPGGIAVQTSVRGT